MRDILFPKVIFLFFVFSIIFSQQGVASDKYFDERIFQDNTIIDENSASCIKKGEFIEFEGYLSHQGKALKSVGDIEGFSFSMQFDRDGYYHVYAWWPHSPLDTGYVEYRITHANGFTDVLKNQSESFGQWNSLGIYHFKQNQEYLVQMASKGGETIIVDALRVEYIGVDEPDIGIGVTEISVGTVGESYRYELEAFGGSPPYTWKIINKVPDGLQLDTISGILSGIPRKSGQFILTIEISDNDGKSHTVDIPFIVTKKHTTEKPEKSSKQVIEKKSNEVTQEAQIALATEDQSLVQILEATPEGDWVRVNKNLFSDVWTPSELRPLNKLSNPTPHKIILAWSSFAWDSNRGDLWLYGGGHANYSGNDVYRWKGATQMWERASLPSEIMQDDFGNWRAIDGVDAAPSSAHTYDNNIFLPNADRFLVLGGAAYNNGGAFIRQLNETTTIKTGPYFFDPDRADPSKVGGTTGSHVKRQGDHPEILGGQMWENRDFYQNLPTAALPSSYVSGVTGITEENYKDVVLIGGRIGSTATALYKYTVNNPDDPTQDTLEMVGRYWVGTSKDSVGAYDPVKKVFVRTGTSDKPFSYWDLNKAGPTNKDVLFTPEDPSGTFVMNIDDGMDFDPIRQQFVIWEGGGSVWTLTPPDIISPTGWKIFKQKQPTPGSSIPSTNLGTGILGKWKYASNLDAFVALQDDIAGNVWLYKPIGWQRPTESNLSRVTITNPKNNDVFAYGGNVPISIDVIGVVENIAKVEFFQGITKIGEDLVSPYELVWSNPDVGSYVLTATATDNSGETKTSDPVNISVTVNNSLPVVAITSPSEGQTYTFGDDIQIAADASDSDGNIAKVEFYQGNTKLGEDLAAPYSFTWVNPSAGNYALTAIATDNLGGTGASVGVNVVVLDNGDVTMTLQDGIDGYSGTRDTYLSSYHKTINFGLTTQLNERSALYTILVRFAIFQSEGGPIPDGAIIKSAKLSLYKYSAYNYSYQIHRLLNDWNEVQATWNNRSLGIPWVSGGASQSGSDFMATADGAMSVGWDPQWLEFNVTSAVQEINSGANNFGWRLVAVSGNNNEKKFYSRETQTDASLRPKLTVEFSSP